MFRVLQTSAENHTADTAKAIDTYFDTQFYSVPPKCFDEVLC